MARRKTKRAPARTSRRPPRGSLSTDWYWEQDAALRFTRVEVQSGAPGEQELAGSILGKRRWETGIEVEGGWEAHRKLLEARAPFRELLMWRDFDDGRRRYVSVSGEPLFDARGRFAGYRGVGRDVTEQKRGEQLLRLQHAVTRDMAEAQSAAQGVQACLRAICESEGWDYAEFWRLDAAPGAMRCFARWVAEALPGARAYAEGSREVTLRRPGEGLVGAVWQSAAPLWIPDSAQDERTTRMALAARTGLHAALLCPVPSGGRVVGVLSFACRSIRPPDDALTQALTAVATQLGLFLRRADAEDSLRQSEERFRRTFELAAVGVAHIGLDRRFQRVNRRFCEILGYPEAELIGITGRDISHPDDIDAMNAQRPSLYAGEIDAVRGEKRYLRKDGAVVWVAYRLAVERDAAGKPLYEIAVYDDISARRTAEEALRDSEARFRQVVDSANEGILVYDRELNILTANAAAARIVGVPLAELIGRPGFTSFFPCVREDGSPLPEQDRPTKATTRRGEPITGLVVGLVRPGGDITWLSVNTGFLRRPGESAHYGIVSTIRDISERRRDELKLRLEHGVSSALSEAKSAQAGVAGVLQLVCEAEGWGCGRYFEVDKAADELAFRQGWSARDPALEAFLQHSEGQRFKRGQGLSGLAWQGGEPIWSTDVPGDERALDKRLLHGAARGAFVFGAAAEGETLGVLSFTSRTVRKPDERLLAAARVIGAQVGQFLRRMQAEASLRESEARFRSLTEMSSDFFWETDAQHRFVDVVHGPEHPEGMGSILGHTAWDLPYVHPDEATWAAIRATMDAHRPFRDFEFGRPWPVGSVRYFSVNGEPRFAPDGAFLGYRGVGRDVTNVAVARERIATLAYHDALTGLDNRTSLAPTLEKAVERTRRRATRLAGLFLDLDGFKEVNDAHGHDAGDRLLVEAARRLRATLRSSDPVARLGGDEFFVVLEDLNDAAPAERVAQKLLVELQQPYEIGAGKEVRISASIGVSLFPDDAGDAATLMKHADAAMYAAKQAGKNAYRFFGALPAANDGREETRSDRAG